jgi:hypothetical protein
MLRRFDRDPRGLRGDESRRAGRTCIRSEARIEARELQQLFGQLRQAPQGELDLPQTPAGRLVAEFDRQLLRLSQGSSDRRS